VLLVGRVDKAHGLRGEVVVSLITNRDERVGYATSLMYSPALQRHIAIARVLPEYAAKVSTVHLEVTVDHEYLSVPATTDRLPLYNPPRKTSATPREPITISNRMEHR